MCLSFFNSYLILMGHSISMVNIKWHQRIKPDLNDQFKQLCSSHTPVTKLLFGDDLPKAVKEISKTNREGVRVSSKLTTHYNKQQKRANFSHRQHHQSQKFLQTGIIETTTLCEGEYISNIFIRATKDRLCGLILNLKKLHQFLSIPPFQNGKPKNVPLL